MLDLFPDYRRLTRRLLKLIRRKKIIMPGTVSLKEIGRPVNLYAAPGLFWKYDWFAHDLRLSKVFKALGWPTVLRGFDVQKVGKVRPDAVLGNRRFEMDCGTERRSEIEKKVASYQGTNQPVLFITLTQSRMRKLMRWCAAIEDIAFFALWEDLIRLGWQTEWRDIAGDKVVFKP